MRHLLLTAVAGAGLVLAACEPRIEVKSDSQVALAGFSRGELKSITRLDCPEQENKLRRISASADGLSCSYADENGTLVDLRLVGLESRPVAEVLAPYKAELQRLVPRAGVGSDGGTTDGEATVQVEVSEDGHGRGETTRIRMPGVSVDADDENASVVIAGGAITIDADDAHEAVRIRSGDGTLNINASSGEGAEIDVQDDADGEVRATYILAADAPAPSGWRVAAYEARGPKTGPIVVAVLKAKARNDDDAFDGMKDLVRKNIGR